MMKRPAEERRTDGREPLRQAALILGAYLLLRSALGSVRLPAETPPWVIGLGFLLAATVSIGLPAAGLSALVRGCYRASALVGLGIAGILLWLGLVAASRFLPVWALPLAAAAQDLGKVLAAGAIGIALAGKLREPNILVPAALFAAFADFVVVYFGTVRQALSTEQGRALVEAVSVRVPAMHPALGVTIGPADFLFLGIFLACAARFEMGVKRTAVALAVVLILSLLLVPFVRALPALAPMSLAFLAVNWRQFRLTRQEMIGSVLVLVAAGGLFLAFFLARR